MAPRFLLLGRNPATDNGPVPETSVPDWKQADLTRIQSALRASQAKPSGGWVVLDGSDTFRERPRRLKVNGREWVAWRCASGVQVAPEACPHMGAPLSEGRVDPDGRIVCPWHGLKLGETASDDGTHGGWRPLRTFDDGVLVWARLDRLCRDGETPSERPFLPQRPARFIAGVIRMEARCAAPDVIQNRLDPWHGAHFHPHSFGRLSILSQSDDAITVRVVYRIAGPVGIEVDARFDCPDPRTIVMTIVGGDGAGSVVETHACPVDEQHTAIIEATLASSDRPMAMPVMGVLRRVLRPVIESRARRLWVEDAAYCERLAELRSKSR